MDRICMDCKCCYGKKAGDGVTHGLCRRCSDIRMEYLDDVDTVREWGLAGIRYVKRTGHWVKGEVRSFLGGHVTVRWPGEEADTVESPRNLEVCSEA